MIKDVVEDRPVTVVEDATTKYLQMVFVKEHWGHGMEPSKGILAALLLAIPFWVILVLGIVTF